MEASMLEATFAICQNPKENALLSLPASTLVTTEGANQLITTYQPLIKGLYPTVAATFFSYSLAIASAGFQYLISVQNSSIDFSLDNLTIQIVPVENDYRIFFCVHNFTAQAGPESKDERESWRQQLLATYYGQTVQPILQILSTVTGVNIRLLWGQFPGIFEYFIDLLKEDQHLQIFQQRVLDDYSFLRDGLDFSTFGCKRSPFQVKIRLIQDMEDPTKMIRMRSTCCLYYQTHDGEYCYTCPRLSEKEREKRRLQYSNV